MVFGTTIHTISPTDLTRVNDPATVETTADFSPESGYEFDGYSF